MSIIRDLLLKLRYSVLLLMAGILMILLAQHTLNGTWNKLEIHERPSTSVVYLLIGIGMILASLLLYLVEYEDVAPWLKCKLINTDIGFKTVFKNSELHVDFGVLQDLYSPIDGCVVVLPANEFFDDRCFNDVHTAAGAFIRSAFNPSQAVALKGLIEEQLKDCSYEQVLRRDRQTAKSYGTGKCVYLEHPFGSPHRVILAAVATDRENTGLRTDMASIFQVMNGVHRIIAAERDISIIYIPLLGAGKGGVPAQLAFRALTIAALEARCAEGGHAMKQVHLVVYQPESMDAQVPVRRAKRAVRELVSLYQETAR